MQKIVFFDCMSMLLLWSWHSSVGRICQSCNFEQTMLLGWNSTGSYLLRIAGNWSWALFAPKLGHFCPEVEPFLPLKLESKCWINNTDDATQLGKPEAVLGPLLTAVFNMSQWLVKKIQSDGKHWIFTANFCLNVLKRKVKPENSGFFQNYFFSYFWKTLKTSVHACLYHP